MRRLAVFAAVFTLSVAPAQTGRHDRMLVVPATKGMSIDGDLREWDMSAAIDALFDEVLKPRFTVRLACMYDAKALYVAAHFVDDTPMLNRHDPHIEPGLGWAGDCLQMRLCSDPAASYPLGDSNADSICHATMWYFTDAKLPVLQLQHGMDYHGTKVLAGKGYVLEARLPWAVLNANATPPKAGEEQQPLTIALPVPDPQARVVSAAIYDSGGVMVRTLPVTSLSKAVSERSFTLRWDGLDDDGNPLPAGRYKVKVLTHRGIGLRWVTSLHNAGNPPWRTDDGTGSWGGDHAPPIAATSDRERVYLGWTVSEAG